MKRWNIIARFACLMAFCVLMGYATFSCWAHSLFRAFSVDVWNCRFHHGEPYTLVELKGENDALLLERRVTARTERLSHALNRYVSLSFVLNFDETGYCYNLQKELNVASCTFELEREECLLAGMIIE